MAQRAEPDLKHGRGGLRDVQLLDALATAQLVDRPGADVLEARDLLLDVRTELRRAVGRARDVLRAQDGDEVAAALGMGDRFELARGAVLGRPFRRRTRWTWRSGPSAARRRGGASACAGGPVRKPLAEGVVLHGARGRAGPGRRPGP